MERRPYEEKRNDAKCAYSSALYSSWLCFFLKSYERLSSWFLGNDFDALKRLQKHQHHGLSNRDEAKGTSLGSESAEEEEDEGGGGEVRDDDVLVPHEKDAASRRRRRRRRKRGGGGRNENGDDGGNDEKGIVVVMEEVMRKTKRRVKARSARARNY